MAELAARYEALGRAGGRLWQLEPARSRVRILVFRGGRASALGHNHVLTAPQFDGWVHVPDGGLAAARFDLVFRLPELTLDNAADRAALGPAYASPLTPPLVAGTREHMLGDSGLQADRYPELRVRGAEIQGEPPFLAARVAITLHGVTREQWVALRVDGLPERLDVAGSLVLRQTDFDLRPYTVAGGLLAVEDAVVVTFELAGR